ncbi:MAG TPA: hypothetical protein VKW04_09135 [Planctomycetota bacterium]|jgi:hypothetical protein|nr:hypothetical protein [Planctomycetota bacterium]
MAGISGSSPRAPRIIPGATLTLFAIALSELRGDLRRLLDSGWDEPVRRRAEELSETLAQACQRQGLKDLLPLLRATTNLTRLSKTSAIPVLAALREKFDSLMTETEALLPKRSTRSLG